MIPEWLEAVFVVFYLIAFFFLGFVLGSALMLARKQAEIDRMRDYLNKLEDLK